MSHEHAPPHIDYLARDFAGFRQLLLDHLSVLAPGWEERSAADHGNALIDLLAYAADYMSYYQDAAATEMYLGTARLRRSARRHAQLLDYHLHDGCNARLWAYVELHACTTRREGILLPKGTQLLTGVEGDRPPPKFLQGSADYADTLAQAPIIFETMHDARLFPEHNMITFVRHGSYSELPAGAVAAGDLLTVAAAEGNARRGGVFLRPGTVIGKALGTFVPNDTGAPGLVDAMITLA